MYDIGSFEVFIFRCKQVLDVRCPTNSRQTGVQQAMNKDWAGQVENLPVQGETLTAVECRRVRKAQGKAAPLDRLAGVLGVKVKADAGKIEESIISRRNLA